MIVTRNAARVLGRALGLALGVLVPLAATIVHGQSCGCEVSDRKEAAYDWLLALDAQESEAALEDYLLMVTSIKLDDMSKIYYLFDTS
jgi:hypothetical protein